MTVAGCSINTLACKILNSVGKILGCMTCMRSERHILVSLRRYCTWHSHRFCVPRLPATWHTVAVLNSSTHTEQIYDVRNSEAPGKSPPRVLKQMCFVKHQCLGLTSETNALVWINMKCPCTCASMSLNLFAGRILNGNFQYRDSIFLVLTHIISLLLSASRFLVTSY
jgi:hypothetical protein